MAADRRLDAPRFPRASKYNPDWILASVSGGANPLWLTEWLTEDLDLRPGMKVLDLGCGRATSSIFLAREFGVQVWATDLWCSASENLSRINDAGLADRVFPIHAEARSLPFANGFFDAVISIDSYFYYGTDDLYLNEVARFVKPDGVIAIAQAAILEEIDGPPPPHLADWWNQDRPLILHSAAWWRRHWNRTGILDIQLADTLADGWQYWLQWMKVIAPGNSVEINALEADCGRFMGYIRAIGRRRADAPVTDPVTSVQTEYSAHPLLRAE
jgi:SAM-dependent methyltransferase